MVKNSLKQLLRSPGKAILFFLLICASTVLIVLGAGMCMRSFQQIQAAENEFITVGWVTQNPISETETLWNDPCTGMRLNTETAYGPKLLPEDLMFEGANYIRPPESRPIYVAYLPNLNFSSVRDIPYHEAILEFRALEGRDDGGPVEVEITRILYQAPKGIKLRSAGILDPAVYGVDYLTVEVGDTITVCQHGKDIEPYPVEAGKTYVANLQWAPCSKHRDEKSGDIWADEFQPIDGACSSQYDKKGNAVETEFFPPGLWDSWHHFYWFQEVTEDFYEPGHAGIAWLNAAKQKEEGMFEHIFAVLGANSLELLPSYYDRRLVLDDGRWISQEEFDNGAPVCMMSRDVATANGYRAGDKINLSLLASIYNHSLVIDELTTFRYFNMINAQGNPYEPFWDQEYEIAGIFYCTSGWDYRDTCKDMFIIPEKSVKASDENNIAKYKHMKRWSISFQIPNGSMNEFDQALRAAVPGAENLEIDYDDKGLHPSGRSPAQGAVYGLSAFGRRHLCGSCSGGAAHVLLCVQGEEAHRCGAQPGTDKASVPGVASGRNYAYDPGGHCCGQRDRLYAPPGARRGPNRREW